METLFACDDYIFIDNIFHQIATNILPITIAIILLPIATFITFSDIHKINQKVKVS